MTPTRPNGPCLGRRTRPVTTSSYSLRSTARPSCCGASTATPHGCGPSRRTRSPTCSPSTWGSPRGCCPRRPSGGTRGRPGRWWPSGGRRRSGPSPCNGRRSSLPHGSGCPCRGWSSSARRGARPGSTPQHSGPPTPSSISSGPRPSTSSGTGGSAPEATGSPRRWRLIPEGFFQSFFSLTGDTRDRSKKHPDNLQALWEEIDGKPEYPMEDLVPQCTVAQAIAVSEGRRGYRYG